MVNQVTVVRQPKDAFTVVAGDMETNLITIRGRQNVRRGIRSVSDARKCRKSQKPSVRNANKKEPKSDDEGEGEGNNTVGSVYGAGQFCKINWVQTEEGWYLITSGMDGGSLERSLRDILKSKSKSRYAERHISSWVSKSLGETDHRTGWPQCLTQER